MIPFDVRSEKVKIGKKIVGDVSFCFSPSNVNANKKQFILSLSKDIKDTSVGYAGFKSKKGLQNYLLGMVFDKKYGNNIIAETNFDEEKIINLVKKALILSFNVLPNNVDHVFVFPTFSKFVREKMSGVTGYTPWKSTILIFINPLNLAWKEAFGKTVCHEYNHSVFFRYRKCETLLDAMILEGLAEHFREQIIGGGQAPWTKVFNSNRARDLFVKMESEGLTKSTNAKVYHAVFFDNKKFVRWTGYTIGYLIVKSFFARNTPLEWRAVMKIPPKEILKCSGFKM